MSRRSRRIRRTRPAFAQRHRSRPPRPHGSAPDLTWRQLRVERRTTRRLATHRVPARARPCPGGRSQLTGDRPLRRRAGARSVLACQQRWHSVASAAAQAHTAFEQASANLASAKEAYAQLIRGGPPPSSSAQPTTGGDDQLPAAAAPRMGDHAQRYPPPPRVAPLLNAGASPQLHAVANPAQRLARRRPTRGRRRDGEPAADLPTNGKPPAEAPPR